MSRFQDLQLEEDDTERPTFFRFLKSWLSSAAIHLAILLVLLLWTIPIVEHGTLNLTAFLGDSPTEEIDEISFSIEESDLELEVVESAPMPMESLAEDRAFAEPVLDDVFAHMAKLDPPSLLDRVDSNSNSPDEPSVTAGSGKVADAASVEAAVDRITHGIQGALGEGDVLVVWLLDASLSLKDDRQRVAGRLEEFLEDLSQTSEHQLRNAVVSFGRRNSERVSATTNSKKVLKASKDAPTDRSGFENVFAAVGQCVAKYRRNWKKKLMIVVWTDESGDDTKLLDKTIAICNRSKVSVSVVGPSSVLGSDTGLHAYIDPKTKILHQLPVKRGPDSAMPERIRLQYWHPVNSFRRRRRGGSWMGGRYMEGIASGFSPYALTRLSMETGGSYTIFDRPEDRAPFDFDRLVAYAPNYVDEATYTADLKRHPLRLAVHKAVVFTHKSKLTPPPLALFNAQHVNGRRVFPYVHPNQFASKLKGSSARLEAIGKRYGSKVEQALAFVSAGGEVQNGEMISEYAQEESPRWRAWYDLTRGRLLASAIRAEEYGFTIANLSKQQLRTGTNAIVLSSTNDLLSTSAAVDQRVDEATTLLERCVRENPNTPWAYLAQQELAHGLGIRASQLQLTPVEVSPQKKRTLPKF